MRRRDFFRTGLAVAGAGATGLAAPPKLDALARWFDPRSVDRNDLIRLNSNENPLGVSPAGRRAVIDGLDGANRYPGETGTRLRARLGRHLGIEPDRLFLGAGSTEILRVTVQAWSAPGDRLIVASPTFEDVSRYGAPLPYEVVEVPLDARGAHDLDRMRAETERNGSATVVYLCNPNNPTGTVTASSSIDAWIRDAPGHVRFLVDEAYVEYARSAKYHSALDWTAERENVVVVRTFSKIYGMAGMRIGYGVAHPRTVARMQPFVTRNNPNHLAGVAAIASLDDEGLVARSLEVNRRAVETVYEGLRELEIEAMPSHTNFIMHRISGRLSDHIERMAGAGFRVGRPFAPMLGWNRVSMSLPEHMERYVGTLHDFRRRGWI